MIGSRGRNWPIRDANDQTRLIKSAILPKSTSDANPPAPSTPSLPANVEKTAEEIPRAASPGKRHIKDPYAAESLFDLLSPGNDRTESVRAPRAPASARPPPREYSEIFVGGDDDTPDASPSKRPVAPKAGSSKHYQPSRIFNDYENDTESPKVVAPKAGASKNYRQSRIFDDDATVAAEQAQTPNYRTHPNKYNHFQIGADNSEREVKAIPTRPKSQHMPQWSFEDFVTPDRPVRQPRGQEIRHFGWSDDEPDLQETPPAKPRVPQPRRDAESQIELTDEIDEPKAPRMIKSHQNKGLSLYKNPLYNEEDDIEEKDNKGPLAAIANGAHRKKDFDSHWTMADSSPADANANIENRKPVGTDRQKAVKMMESSWETYDESPEPTKAAPPRRAVRNVNDRSWDLGDL